MPYILRMAEHDTRIEVRLSENLKRGVTKLADRCGLKPATYIRLLIETAIDNVTEFHLTGPAKRRTSKS